MNELRNRTAIYCRLSQDDGINGDSSSIQTQRMMLEQYSNEHNLKIVDVYVDDGYSGLNFNRPGFKRLVSSILKAHFRTKISIDRQAHNIPKNNYCIRSCS